MNRESPGFRRGECQAVCRYTVYKKGVKVVDIDPLNQVHMVNGKDCAADIRKLLGMT